MISAVLPFPDIGPELIRFELGPIVVAIRWYALAYIVGLLVAWRIILMAVRNERLWQPKTSPMTPEMVENIATWAIIGVILGGRLGFVLFYQPAYYLSNPLEILKVWQGGMSFHGGFLGIVVGTYIFSRRYDLRMGSVSDLMALGVTPGLLLGRIANFINAELWGRPSDLPWAVIFPGAAAQDCVGVIGMCARHPSQLYEAALEGLLLGFVLFWVAFRRGGLGRPWQITGIFFAGYGAARFFVEFFRQADAQFISPDNPLGYALQFGGYGLSMGQLLSAPMIIIGVALIIYSRRAR
jgi:phosphatidylglycerol:prolipoprotein diacylglycerol transferase